MRQDIERHDRVELLRAFHKIGVRAGDAGTVMEAHAMTDCYDHVILLDDPKIVVFVYDHEVKKQLAKENGPNNIRPPFQPGNPFDK